MKAGSLLLASSVVICAAIGLMSRTCQPTIRADPDVILTISSEDPLDSLKVYEEIAETLDRMGVVYDMASSSGVFNVEIYEEIDTGFIEWVKSRYNSKSEVVRFSPGDDVPK